MRALAGPMYLEKKYVNTCNGIVLLTGKPRPSMCVLWNPAVAGEHKEVTVPVSARDGCGILGLGYGPRSGSYKLLLTRRWRPQKSSDSGPRILRSPKELLVYDLGGAGEQPRLRALPSSKGLDGEIINGESLYIDGTIYLLNIHNSTILAFDVDDETVTTIDLPGKGAPLRRRAMSALLALVASGRPCVDVKHRRGRALWLLTAEGLWERLCFVYRGHDDDGLDNYSIAGVWDCGGMLVMYFHMSRRRYNDDEDDKLFLYCTATKKMNKLDLPFSMTPDGSDYSMCWGYKPTLLSPGSIVGELDQDEGGHRDCMADVMEAVNPLSERATRKGKKATLDTVCFMDLLVRILQKLPENVADVIAMPLLRSEDEDSDSSSGSSDDELYHSDSGSSEDELYHSDSDFVLRLPCP
ncbi:unnamed protein product [Urochloa humidicola]